MKIIFKYIKNIFLNEVAQLKMIWINLEKRSKNSMGNLYHY